MGSIQVYVPEVTGASERTSGKRARRDTLRPPHVLTVVENGKPNARTLLQLIAERVGEQVPLERIETVSKPTASAPIDADQARMQAARSHLIITGVGD